jgi:membrane protein
VDVLKEIWSVILEIYDKFFEDNVPRLSAALAFYTTFSAAPALVIGLWVAGAFIGSEAAHSELANDLRDYIGPEATTFLFESLYSSKERIIGKTATIIGIGASLIGATLVFIELKNAFNLIWNVNLRDKFFIFRLILIRVESFLLVLAIGAFIVVSMVFSAVIAGVDQFFPSSLPMHTEIIQNLDLLVTWLLNTLLMATLFKVLPDTKVYWREVWLGAIFTSILVTIGKYILGVYLAHSSLSSIYGAAGSFVLMLLWVYYSAYVLYLGAILTEVTTRRKRAKAETTA